MKRTARIFALAALSVATAIAQQYAFLPVAGSPKSAKVLFQDAQGRLWIGGDQASCFDGTRFFSLRDYGLPPAVTYAFADDSSGAMWIATENGVYRFANGRVQLIAPGMAVSVVAATPDLAIAVIGPAGKGVMSDGSVVRMKRSGDTWKTDAIAPMATLNPIALSPDGRLICPWPLHGWLEMRIDDVAKWRPGEELPIDRIAKPRAPGWPVKVMRDHAGCLWVGTVGGNGYDCGDGPHDPMPGGRLESNMHESADGTMVLWGDSMIAVGRPGSFQVATSANGLPGLVDAIRTADGTVWLGTTHGLYRMAGGFRVEHWTTRDGLTAPPWSLTRSGGHMYAGLGGRIVVLSQDRTHWDTFATLQTAMVAGLAGAPDGGLFAALNGGGTVQVSPTGKVIARTPAGNPNVSMRVTRTENGEIWSSDLGLRRITREGAVLHAVEQPLQTQPPRNVLSIRYEPHTHKLWSCYSGGAVVRDEKGAWREFTTRDGLLIDGCWAVAPLPNGDVWYAYFNLPALALFRPNPSGGYTIRQYQAKDGLIEPGGDSLDLDRAGRLWRGGDLGVYIADPGEAEAGTWLQIDQSDGLPVNDINSGSAFADDDGSMWWGADNDLAHVIQPADLVTPRFAPQVFVSAFTWDGTPRLADGIDALPRGSNITAHIGSLQFDRRNALRLRYRLLPAQTAWRETSSFDLPLGKLGAGRHTLEVQGRVFTGPWSSSVIRSWNVPLPMWLAWPMVTAYFLAATLVPAALYRWRRRRQAEEAEILPDLAAWRLGALLPDVHDVTGTVLDSRFEVGALLARGGFANVFAGFDRQRTRPCAVKIFRSEMKGSATILRTFEQEVAALQKVCHSNVVSIYARGVAPSGSPYLVMEFIEGRNLREVLDAGPIAPERCARFLRDLAGALDCIHAQGICHRDVKPENVMIRDEGSPRESAVLIDFSIAIVKDANETLHGLSRAAGSFDYMAPEQAIGYAEPSSDIYSLAKVAIEMLTRRQLKELLPDAAMDLPQRVRELLRTRGAGLSEESAAMLASALEFDPSRRPRAAGPFAVPIARDLESQVRLRGR